MPPRSDKTGFRCTAIYDGVQCPSMTCVETVRHYNDGQVTRRSRKCTYCGARQKTKECADGPNWQPKVPIYRRLEDKTVIDRQERCLDDFCKYLSSED